MEPSPSLLENHPAYLSLGSAHEGVVDALRLDNLTPNVVAVLRQAEAATAFAQAKFKTTNFDLVPGGALQNIQSAAAEIIDNAGQYVSTRNDAQLGAIRQATERILVALSNFLTLLNSDELATLVASAKTYSNELDKAITATRLKAEEITRTSEESREALNQAAKVSREKLEQATASSLQKVEELGAQISDERQKLLNLATDYQSQFSTAQDQRAKDFSDTKEAQQEKNRQLLDEYSRKLVATDAALTQEAKDRASAFEAEIDALRTEHLASATDILGKMEESKKQVEDLVGVIGNLGVTSGYLRQANVARYVMWFWQLVALGALGSLVWIAVRAFLPAAEGATSFTWQTFASRISIALAIGLLAAYAAAQGEKASNQERRNRRLALELEAIGPFLAPMKPEEQQKFRYQIGEKSFGVDPDQWGTASRKDRDAATIIGHLLKNKEFRELLVTIFKAGRP